MAELNDWNVAAAGNNSAPPDGWPENTMQYSDVNNTAREGMAVVARYFKDINGSLAAGGVANAYTLTLNASYAAYFEGMYFVCSIPADNTGASTINVNALGVKTITDRAGNALGAGELESGGLYEFRYDGTNFQLMGTTPSSFTGTAVNVLADINTATPPTIEAVTANYETYDAANNDLLAQVGFSGSNALGVRNRMHGGVVELVGENTAGTAVFMFRSFPDGGSVIYHPGSAAVRLQTGGAGVLALRSDDSLDTSVREIQFQHSDATVRGRMGHIGTANLEIRNTIHGGQLNLYGEDTGGALRVLFSGNPDGETSMYYNGNIRIQAGASGVARARSDASPGIGSAQAVRILLEQNDGVDLAQIGFVSSTHLQIDNLNHGGRVDILGENTGGTPVVMATFDPDSNFGLYHAGVATLLSSAGIINLRSVTSTDSENRYISFEHQDGTDRGLIGYSASNSLCMRNIITSAWVTMEARNAAAVNRVGLEFDPDAFIRLRDPIGNVVRLSTLASGQLGLLSDGNTDAEARNLALRWQNGTTRAVIGHTTDGILRFTNQVHGAGVALSTESVGGNVRNVLVSDPDTQTDIYHPAGNSINLQTQTEDAADSTSGALVRGPDDALHGIGYNYLPGEAVSGANHTLAQADQGKSIDYNEATARTLNLNNDANIPVNAFFGYYVGPSAGTFTIQAGAGVTIEYWNGSSWTTTAAAGSITAGEGQGTIRKISDTNYRVSGPNLS